VIWLHSYGERFFDPAPGANRPAGPPRMANGPTIPADGAIPSDPDRFPGGDLRYDADARRLCSIPDDHIDPRRSALFMARSVLREARDGDRTC